MEIPFIFNRHYLLVKIFLKFGYIGRVRKMAEKDPELTLSHGHSEIDRSICKINSENDPKIGRTNL